MTELLQLVRDYISGRIAYEGFRKDMVVRFLSMRNSDPAVEVAANLIECACADYSESLISSEEFQRRIAAAVAPQMASAAPSIVVSVCEFDQAFLTSETTAWGSKFGVATSASGTMSAPELPLGTSNWPNWPNVAELEVRQS